MFNRRNLSIISLLIVLLFSLSIFTGCSAQPTTAPTTDAPKQTPVVDSDKVIKDAAEKYYEKMPTHIYKISEDETKALLDKGELKDYLVLDVRDDKSYKAGHIEGAILVPFKEVGKNLDQIASNSKGKKGILVVCVTGQTAGQTVAALNLLGLPARSINLGMKLGWEAKKYPTETKENKFQSTESYDWGDKAPIKKAVENYYDKMPSGMFGLYKISEDDLKAQLASNPEKFLVVDIREKKDFDAGTIKGAINIPFKEIGNNFAKLEDSAKGKTVVVACYTGQTAGQTDTVLNLIGIKTVSLNRGISAGWIKEKGFEVVKP